MASSRARSADIKLIVSATVAVLLAGFLIAGAALIATRGGGSVVCGRLNLGSASDVRNTLDKGGPYFTTGGAQCGFWLALDNGDIAAYKVEQPPRGTLKWKRDHWECSGVTVDAADLAQFPVSIQTVGQIDSVVVDLVPPGATPTTTATTATTTG